MDDFPYNSIQKMCCWYSLELPPQDDSNEYPQHILIWRTKENCPLITGLDAGFHKEGSFPTIWGVG